MVQGGLLTVPPGSIHGGGEAPGGGSSLRQGAGKTSAGAPDLGSAAAAEPQRDRKKGSCSEGFTLRGINRRKGTARGGPGAPGAPWRAQGPGRALWPPGPP